MKSALRYFIPAGIALLAVSGSLWSVWHPQAPRKPLTVHCASLPQGCSFLLGNQPVQVRFANQPTGLVPFTVQVTAPAQQVAASFSMQGMDMGTIRYALQPVGKNRWQASITLPVCVTGRQDWLMLLDVDGRQVMVPFASTG